MEKFLKQCLGIDVSKDTLDASMSRINEKLEVIHVEQRQFANNEKGFHDLIRWMDRNRLAEVPCQVVVEATGVYHEHLAYRLVKNKINLAIVLPCKIKNYSRSTNIRTVTDKISARQIAEFGLVKTLINWTPPDPVYRFLKGLCRERVRILNDKTMALNQKHASDYSVLTSQSTLKRHKDRIKYFEKQIKEIEKEILETVNKNADIKRKLEKVCSIKGVGIITAVTILAETNGFEHIRNVRQLVCYCGYDIVVKESGTSVHSKAKMSHKGNRYIRRILHFPAITAVKYNKSLSGFYHRLYERQNIKMKSYVAIQRKLLILIYTLWKKDQYYDPDYMAHSLEKTPIEQCNQMNQSLDPARNSDHAKILGQTKNAALTELVLDRSVDSIIHVQS